MWAIVLLHEIQLGLGAVAKLSGGVTEGKAHRWLEVTSIEMMYPHDTLVFLLPALCANERQMHQFCCINVFPCTTPAFSTSVDELFHDVLER